MSEIEALRGTAETLRCQHGLITAAQAHELGVNRERCRQLVLRHIWERVRRGLYGPVGMPWTWRRRLMAAVLLAPEGSLASHRCGAHLLGVGGLVEPQPEITIARGKRMRRDDVVVHESTDLQLADRIVIDGIPTTGPRRLAMDLGAVVSEARFRHTLRELRFQHGVTSEQLLRTYLRHKRSGRDGGGALRDWLDRYYAVEGVAESGLEQVTLDAFIDAGLPTPVLQLWIDTGAGRFRVDMAFPGLAIVVEVDGSQHEGVGATCDDAIRDAALEALGWTVVRIRRRTFASDLQRAIRVIRAKPLAAVRQDRP